MRKSKRCNTLFCTYQCHGPLSCVYSGDALPWRFCCILCTSFLLVFADYCAHASATVMQPLLYCPFDTHSIYGGGTETSKMLTIETKTVFLFENTIRIEATYTNSSGFYTHGNEMEKKGDGEQGIDGLVKNDWCYLTKCHKTCPSILRVLLNFNPQHWRYPSAIWCSCM